MKLKSFDAVGEFFFQHRRPTTCLSPFFNPLPCAGASAGEGGGPCTRAARKHCRRRAALAHARAAAGRHACAAACPAADPFRSLLPPPVLKHVRRQAADQRAAAPKCLSNSYSQWSHSLRLWSALRVELCLPRGPGREPPVADPIFLLCLFTIEFSKKIQKKQLNPSNLLSNIN